MQNPAPFEPASAINAALQDLDIDLVERARLRSTAQLFARGQPPVPTAEQTQLLIAHLLPALPHPQRDHGDPVRGLWGIARAQISLLQPSFWLLSALITVLGSFALVPNIHSNEALILRVIGPLLAYLGTLSVFRGISMAVLEFELACPPSRLQLTIARLAVVLGYDLTLGGALSLVLWAYGGGSVFVVTLHWLMPMLFVTGLALWLSLWMVPTLAAMVAYSGWLLMLALDSGWFLSKSLIPPLSSVGETLFGVIGLLLLAITLAHIQVAAPRWLQR